MNAGIIELELLLDKINLLFTQIRKEGEMTKVDHDLLARYIDQFRETLDPAFAQLPSLNGREVHLPREEEIKKSVPDISDRIPEKQKIHLPEQETVPEKEEKISEKKPGDELHEKENADLNLNAKLSKEKVTLVDKINKPVQDLRSAIGLNEKFFFIRELFHGDHNAYESVIRKLNAFPSFDVAAKYIEQDLSATYGWSDKSQVDRLLQVVLEKFQQND